MASQKTALFEKIIEKMITKSWRWEQSKADGFQCHCESNLLASFQEIANEVPIVLRIVQITGK